MKPLECPEFYELAHNASTAEKFWKRIPILGWTIAASMWYQRASPVERAITQQLLARPKPEAEVWGEDLRLQEIGPFVSAVAAKEMGWPNDHFIPDDPFEIVFWSHNDALDIDEALLWIEEHLEIEFEESEVMNWWEKTLGQVIDLWVAKAAHSIEQHP